MRRFLVLCAVVGLAVAQAPIVSIPGMGDVEGDQHLSFSLDRPFYRYRGMPFAAPPVGPLRFQPPAPAEPWSGVFNATSLGQRCPQLGIGVKSSMDWHFGASELDQDVRASDDAEDCLYLSVYTPRAEVGANLPVMLWYHGGGFSLGSGLVYDAFRFMDHDVVVVVPHYRLGPLGFLNLHTDAIPGNAGMLDQVASLQWVKDNIAVFGGDPNRITVFGESAGGASASLLNLSPLSTGLFQQYISMSGSALGSWAIDEDPIRAATDLSVLINCTGSDIPTLTACYQEVDAMDLVRAFNDFYKMEMAAGRNGFASTAPTVQTAGTRRFLEQHPKEIVSSGNYVPKRAMLGSNKHEGTMVFDFMWYGFLLPNNLTENEAFWERDATNAFLDFFEIADSGEAMAAAVEKAYFGLENMGNLTAMFGGLVDFMGDMFLKGPVFEAALANEKVAPTYMYSFNFLGDSSIWRFLGHPSLLPGGVCHANELLLFWDMPPIFVLSLRDRAMARKLVHLWVNFAIYGEPNPAASPVEDVPAWPTMDSGYMRLDDTFSFMSDYTLNEYFIARDESFPW